MDALTSGIDTEDQSFWLPHQGIESLELQVFWGEASGLLGTRLLECYWYEFSLVSGNIWFLQRGPGQRNAEKQFSGMAAAVESLPFVDFRRSA
jgi:hypothetical protein